MTPSILLDLYPVSLNYFYQIISETAVHRCSDNRVNRVHKNPAAEDFFNKGAPVNKDSGTCVFLWILQNFPKRSDFFLSRMIFFNDVNWIPSNRIPSASIAYLK